MHKYCVSLMLILISLGTKAGNILHDTIPINQDSIEQAVDAFIREINRMKKGDSYFYASAGLGNRRFSLQNTALNAQQAGSQLVLTPSAGYMHRSGWGIAYMNFVGFSSNAGGILQHALTASYALNRSEKTDFGISYTAYLAKKEFVNNTSPYDHDVFGYLSAKQGALQPGLAIGWAGGKFSNILSLDTFRTVLINNQPVRIPLRITDTSTFRVGDFSFIGTLKHDFTWEGLNSNHAVTFTPQLMVILGSSATTTVSSTSVIADRRLRLAGTRFGSRRFQSSNSERTPFAFQSIGLSLDAAYYFRHVYINPQLYVDYFLQETTASRLSGVFNINFGVIF